MELNYLREFVVLTQTCQFLEAAEQLYISQSSLSKHIKALEKELGYELLDRSTRHVELSKFGKEFLPYAKQIVQIQENYTEALLNNTDKKPKTITIGLTPLVTLFKLKGFIKKFFINYPSYNIEFVEHSSSALRELLRKDECDIIIVCTSPDDEDEEFYHHEYTKDTLVAVCPKGHPVARKKTVSAADLAKHSLIQLGKENLLQLLPLDLPSSSIITTDRGKDFVDIIAEGIGIGVMTLHAATYHMPPDFVTVPITPPVMIQMDLLYKKPKKSNAFAINAILDHVTQRLAELQKQKPEE